LTVAYRRVFDRLEAGEAMTPDEIKAAASLDLGAVVERARSGMLAALRPADEARRQQEEWAKLLEPQWAELDAGLQAELDADVAAVAEREGVSIERGSPLWKAVRDSIARGKRAAMRDYLRPPTAPEAERSATESGSVPPFVRAKCLRSGLGIGNRRYQFCRLLTPRFQRWRSAAFFMRGFARLHN
jgi:hypothetical protein